MYLLVGLGNPGKKYERTRHNIGFRILDALVSEYHGTWKYEKKLDAEVCTLQTTNSKLLCLKPQTFMNLSGASVKKALAWFEISVQDFLVVYDDKDMEFGKLRYREKGSSGGHNGINSIIKELGTEEFQRMKIGVANEQIQTYDTADFVLAKFSKDEEKKLPEIIQKALEKIQLLIAKGE